MRAFFDDQRVTPTVLTFLRDTRVAGEKDDLVDSSGGGGREGGERGRGGRARPALECTFLLSVSFIFFSSSIFSWQIWGKVVRFEATKTEAILFSKKHKHWRERGGEDSPG